MSEIEKDNLNTEEAAEEIVEETTEAVEQLKKQPKQTLLLNWKQRLRHLKKLLRLIRTNISDCLLNMTTSASAQFRKSLTLHTMLQQRLHLKLSQ